jgi:replicative DNA helicase
MSSTEWQDALLYHATWGEASDVLTQVGIDDFDPGDRQEMFAIIERGYLDGTLQPAWVQGEAQRLGRPSTTYVANVLSAGFVGGSVSYYANQLREASSRRYALKILTQGITRLEHQESITDDVVGDVQAQLQAMPRPSVSDDDAWTLNDIMGLEIKPEDYTLPNMLKRNERLVLTGSEGGGKSVFVYQLLTGAAFGVDTFALNRTEPSRVLFIDVENNEFQAKANLDKIVPALKEIAPDAEPEWRSLKRRVVDLLATKDRADIIRRVVHYNPDILYMGTAYKLTDLSDETHRSVRAIQSVVDRIRQEIGCTVIVEHHAGHGHQNDRNGMRPEGSSYWLRWPDFGYGMQPLLTQDKRRLMRLGAWRGDRATDRQFPVAVKQGSVMPWVPVYQDEWDALYANTYDK